MLSEDAKFVIESARKILGKTPDDFSFAPGRGNTLGEHIDYSGGTVAPITISRGCNLAIARGSNSVISIHNLDNHKGLESNFTCDIEEFYNNGKLKSPKDVQAIFHNPKTGWSGYLAGAFYILLKAGKIKTKLGADVVFHSSVPIASGLSSSASLEVAMMTAVNRAFRLRLGWPQIALLSQRVEHEVKGVPCGIMDQYTAALGKKDWVMFLDCNKMFTVQRRVPKGFCFLFANTGKQRSLEMSEYARRRADCEKGFSILKKNFSRIRKRAGDIENLCQLTPKQFSEMSDVLPERIRQRCEHAVNEQARVLAYKLALWRYDKTKSSGEIEDIGNLLYESHESLKTLYEVSSRELDTIVRISRELGTKKGVYGARMQGAGFGGCCVVFVKEKSIDEIKKAMSKRYEEETGIKPEFYSGSSPGAKEYLRGFKIIGN